MTARLKRLESMTYPSDGVTGVLVAISRRYADDTIRAHQDVRAHRGAVAFGKFLYRRERPGDSTSVKPVSILGRERHEGPAIGFFERRAKAWLGSGRLLSLFVLDPDPPANMWMGRIAQVAMRTSAGHAPDFSPPEFPGYAARDVVPSYYWLEPQKRVHLKYHCNYWFLISSLEQISADALLDMRDLETDDGVTLATAQLYPAEVSLPEKAVVTLSSRPPRSPLVSPALRSVFLDFPALLRGLTRVKLVASAQRDLAHSEQAMVDQTADLVVRMERCGRDVRAIGVRFEPVPESHGLMEFYVANASRVAAGWLADDWWIVGLSAAHPDDHFWKLAKRRWIELQLSTE
jgi:hypothetical protein